MKHKHAELIKAWADGAEIEIGVDEEWIAFDNDEYSWNQGYEYRIKPEPKPDFVRYFVITTTSIIEVNDFNNCKNLKVNFDGETGKLKSAEVLK